MPRPKSATPTYSLTKRTDANGAWYVQWWDGTRARRVSCRTTDKAEARRFLAGLLASADAVPIPRAPTVGAVLDGYQADRVLKSHSPTLGYCCRALKAHLEDLPVDLLTNEVVRRYVADRRAAGAQGAGAVHRKKVRPLSDGTLIRELGVLRRALAWAAQERWIANEPHIERPSAPQPRTRWLTREEADRLLAAAVAPHIRMFIALALYTAGRAGAVLQLTWDRVDLQAGTINLGESRGRKKRAVVPIVAELRPELERAAAIRTSPFLVEFAGGQVASIKSGFRAAVRRAGLADVTPHVLRHTAASWMMQRNVPTAAIAQWLGNTQAMIEKVYGHHSPEWLQQAARAFSKETNS